jgi:hypothetical protein
VIDFTEELIGARFTIENPNATVLLRLRHVVFDVKGAARLASGRRGAGKTAP